MENAGSYSNPSMTISLTVLDMRAYSLIFLLLKGALNKDVFFSHTFPGDHGSYHITVEAMLMTFPVLLQTSPLMSQALLVRDFTKKNTCLNLNAAKCEIVKMTGRSGQSGKKVDLAGHSVQTQDEAKYLFAMGNVGALQGTLNPPGLSIFETCVIPMVTKLGFWKTHALWPQRTSKLKLANAYFIYRTIMQIMLLEFVCNGLLLRYIF